MMDEIFNHKTENLQEKEENYYYEPIKQIPKTQDEIEKVFFCLLKNIKEKEEERIKKAHSILKVTELSFITNYLDEKKLIYGKPNVIHV
jgi:hypothetical protein